MNGEKEFIMAQEQPIRAVSAKQAKVERATTSCAALPVANVGKIKMCSVQVERCHELDRILLLEKVYESSCHYIIYSEYHDTVRPTDILFNSDILRTAFCHQWLRSSRLEP